MPSRKPSSRSSILIAVLLGSSIFLSASVSASHRDECGRHIQIFETNPDGFAQPLDPSRATEYEDCLARTVLEYEQLVSSPQFQEQFGAQNLVRTFEAESRKWVQPIISIAINIFTSLVILEFIWSFGLLALRGTTFEELTVELVKRTIIISIGIFLLTEGGFALLSAVINGFRDTASIASHGSIGENFTASDLLVIPIDVTRAVWEAAEGLNMLTDAPSILAITLAAIIILWALAVAGAQLILVLCETFLVLVIGLFSLAFFSLEQTRDYSMRYFGAIIGTGFKLMALEMIIGLGFTMVNNWIPKPGDIIYHEITPYMIMAGSALIFKELAVKIPNYIQGIFSGAPGSGASAAQAVTGGMAVAGAAVAGAKGAVHHPAAAVLMGRDAAKLAKQDGAKGFAGIARGMAGHVGQAVTGSWADQLRGGRGGVASALKGAGDLRTAEAVAEAAKSTIDKAGRET